MLMTGPQTRPRGSHEPPNGAAPGAGARRSCGGSEKIAHPNQVVGGCPQHEDPVDQREAAVVELPELPDGLQPAEDLLDPLPAALAHRVAGMAGGAAIDRAIPVLGDVLGHVRRDAELATA